MGGVSCDVSRSNPEHYPHSLSTVVERRRYKNKKVGNTEAAGFSGTIKIRLRDKEEGGMMGLS